MKTSSPEKREKRGLSPFSTKKSADRAVNYLLEKTRNKGLETVWDRSERQKPRCGFGESGACCHTCFMGPCRISPSGKGPQRGVCGAKAENIVSRNFARMIAAGAAAHSDHAREVAKTLLEAAKNPASGYSIKDSNKLNKVASVLGVETKDREKEAIASDVAEKALRNFGQQEGEVSFIKLAPETRQALWRNLNIVPRGIDREIVEMMHRTNMGVDQDHRNIMLQAARTALADGWGGSMIATELQDILFGTPSPLRGQVNLGVLSKKDVNIVVHGHEPALSEMLVLAAQDQELVDLAKSKGAQGINLVGICCTANEILLRHGLPIAGNVLQQELAVSTGAVEAMIVDVQCIMPSLPEITKCFHTKLMTTSSKAQIEGAKHFKFSEKNALQTAKEIIKEAIANFPNRGKTDIPQEKMDLVAGFSHEAINYMLGGTFRSSYIPLNDNVINGRIKGVAAVVGCCNPKVIHDQCHVNLVEELIANDILVVQTGCSAIACAKAGFLTPESAEKRAGKGLAEVCKAVGMPPVLHSGSCVDNSRVLIALSEMVKVGGLGKDISELPVAGAAPEWMSEKAIAIGQYFVASGVFTIFGVGLPVSGSEIFSKHIFEEFENIFGGMWAAEPEPAKMAALIIDHINKKREKLGISKAKERILFDMKMRRELEV
jgi:carbon-monoxide dehydrogenase catalytic subunit